MVCICCDYYTIIKWMWYKVYLSSSKWLEYVKRIVKCSWLAKSIDLCIVFEMFFFSSFFFIASIHVTQFTIGLQSFLRYHAPNCYRIRQFGYSSFVAKIGINLRLSVHNRNHIKRIEMAILNKYTHFIPLFDFQSLFEYLWKMNAPAN